MTDIPPDTAPDVVVVTGTRPRRPADTGPVAFPHWRVTLDGRDLTDAMAPRLIRLTLAEKRGVEADQLDIDMDATDGALAIPPHGAVLEVAIGWRGGGGTTPGLIEKGRFTVDEVSHDGPPDTIKIKARSADFTAALRQNRDRSWRGKTLGQVLADIAARHGLQTRIAASLAGKTLRLVAQSRESDAALLARLGREHDAVAAIKAGTLIFLQSGRGETADGTALPAIAIARSDGDRHSYQVQAREDYTGVIAKWHDRRAGREKEELAGTRTNARTLSRRHPTQAEARQAAQAEWSRIQRAPRKMSLGLALGRPEIMPESPVTLSGWTQEITNQDWIVAEVTHSLDGRGGLTSSLSLELRGQSPEASS